MSARRSQTPTTAAASAPEGGLDYLELVTRAREVIPDLPTASLYRIRALLERLLEAGETDPEAMAVLAEAIRDSEA